MIVDDGWRGACPLCEQSMFADEPLAEYEGERDGVHAACLAEKNSRALRAV